MSVDINNLKQQRGQIKGKLTRLKKFFDNLEIFNLNQTNYLELENRFERFEPILDEFENVQSSIENLSSDLDSEQLEREQFEDNYHSLHAQIKNAIVAYKQRIQSSVVQNQPINSNVNSSFAQLKLPSVKLPAFNGHYTEWIEFRDAFTSMIHENNSLSNIDKFYYLRSSLGGEASTIIDSLKPSSSNYSVAWQLLTERFENTRLIIFNHMSAIFEQKPIREDSHKDLRKLLDNTTAHLRNLKILGEPTEYWDTILIHIISSKFDKITMRDWESYKIIGDKPTFQELKTFITERCRFLEKVALTHGTQKEKFIAKIKSKNNSTAFVSATNQLACYYCKKSHTIYKCELFLKLKPFQRELEINRLDLCLNCFKPSHKSENCKISKCKKCGRPHNTLLHYDNLNANNVVSNHEKSNNLSSSNLEQSNSGSCNIATAGQSNFALLSTAVVYVKDADGVFKRCRALLDNGAQNSFITERLGKKLKLKLHSIQYSICGVGQVTSNVKYSTNIDLQSCTSSFNKTVSCLILNEITCDLPTLSFNSENIEIPSNLRTELADPQFNERRSVGLLLGSDVFWEILGNKKIHLDCGLILYETRLGYVMAGNLSLPKNNISSVNLSVSCNENMYQTLENNLMRFWEVEELHSSRKNLSESEMICEKHFQENYTRDDQGQFIVSIPFKPNYENLLGNSREFALNRFYTQERRLLRDELLYEEYKKVMTEYESLGHMSKVDESVNSDIAFYLPHHVVIKASSVTTKLRVVFDASMKSDSNYSLNDIQYAGPVIQNDLFSIILRFRKYHYAMTADISKMYRMVHIQQDQRRFHRLFWRSNPCDDVQCFEMNRVVFGTASAPFLAVRCLFQLGIDCEQSHPKISNIIKNDFYVDDCLTGSDCKGDLVEIQHYLSEILKGGGFQLRQWLTNASDLYEQFKIDDNLNATILHIGENEANKTLGILWNANHDTIEYSISNLKHDIPLTKRSLLSMISQIYDPLGLLGPVIILAKLLMQDLWLENVSWDSSLSDTISVKWLQFRDDLQSLNAFKIPRKIFSKPYLSVELHGFADASERAYGCCIYIRYKENSRVYDSNLLCAKSKVAPLKKLTLPRLELCAAHLLAQLTDKVIKSININFDAVYLWSDSTITLCWIHGCPSRWKSFVANRVSEVQRLTNKNDWHHVGTLDNPADLISRGIRASDIINCEIWWKGPHWLSNQILKFTNFNAPTAIPEQRVFVNFVANDTSEWFSNYSSLSKLQRITAYCLRYIHNVKEAVKNRALGYPFNDNFATGVLSVSNLKTSLKVLIGLSQQQSFPLEYKSLSEGKPVHKRSSLLSLDPFMDNDKLIRVGGRLQNAAHKFDKKHPIILCPKHNLTKLILRNEHIKLLHCGPTLLLSSIRERFWPVRGKNLAKDIVRKCVICFKVNPVSEQYFMGNLPEFRVNQYLPFCNTGIDYAGPVLMKDRSTRSAKLTKAYICLFICMSVKAIHLELVSDLTTECFMAALKRFIGRRGKPSNLYSDNARNFIGANSRLSELGQFLQNQSNTISERLAEDGIQWHFIPSRSPNFGGIWEAGIKRIKFHLKRILGEAHLTYEGFLTALVQIESILNSRPLCPLNSTPDQLNPLTPGHFLIGKSLTAVPEPCVLHVPENRLKHYQRLQKIAEHFWVRWHTEYLSELQSRVKWRQKAQNILKVGMMVLVKEDNVPVMRWHMGRILQLHPGEDEIIRVVTLKMSNGATVKRSVQKLCVFPFERDNNEQ